ncbi:hypothetical protein FB451DRAFT_440818 [Mycena latifolia]|nr:hypothetical protein FB451DRAFT_440818 [Mycena latifolia]
MKFSTIVILAVAMTVSAAPIELLPTRRLFFDDPIIASVISVLQNQPQPIANIGTSRSAISLRSCPLLAVSLYSTAPSSPLSLACSRTNHNRRRTSETSPSATSLSCRLQVLS